MTWQAPDDATPGMPHGAPSSATYLLWKNDLSEKPSCCCCWSTDTTIFALFVQSSSLSRAYWLMHRDPKAATHVNSSSFPQAWSSSSLLFRLSSAFFPDFLSAPDLSLLTVSLLFFAAATCRVCVLVSLSFPPAPFPFLLRTTQMHRQRRACRCT